ncbi:hypothetical protein VNO78_08432 [Psophocarpus tetragonolobus]|uniref:Uncharacterized protein n=1 Tax=Psophocarpus tetragonolobus TaxID=3891 RepID=A0AAN9SXZ1_PSOTE
MGGDCGNEKGSSKGRVCCGFGWLSGSCSLLRIASMVLRWFDGEGHGMVLSNEIDGVASLIPETCNKPALVVGRVSQAIIVGIGENDIDDVLGLE